MREANVPCGVLRNVGEAIRSPEAQAQEIVTRIAHPQLGWIPNMNLPIHYAETPMADPTPAPRIGENTAQVLTDWLGHDEARIQSLARTGAFGTVKAATQGGAST